MLLEATELVKLSHICRDPFVCLLFIFIEQWSGDSQGFSHFFIYEREYGMQSGV